MDNNTLLAVSFISLSILGILIYRLFLFRAVKQVIRIFKENDALAAKDALTREELGLAQKNILERLITWRDYREKALLMLFKLDIIRQTREGKYFLSEKQLSGSGITEKLGEDV